MIKLTADVARGCAALFVKSWAERAIEREASELGEKRVAMGAALQRVDLVRERDRLNWIAGGLDRSAAQVRDEAEAMKREGAQLVRGIRRIDIGIDHQDLDEDEVEAKRAALLAQVENLWPKTLETFDRARRISLQAANTLAQAGVITAKLGKTKGKTTRRERVALARAVGTAAA